MTNEELLAEVERLRAEVASLRAEIQADKARNERLIAQTGGGKAKYHIMLAQPMRSTWLMIDGGEQEVQP